MRFKSENLLRGRHRHFKDMNITTGHSFTSTTLVSRVVQYGGGTPPLMVKLVPPPFLVRISGLHSVVYISSPTHNTSMYINNGTDMGHVEDVSYRGDIVSGNGSNKKSLKFPPCGKTNGLIFMSVWVALKMGIGGRWLDVRVTHALCLAI